jgi:hypothetical protein
MANTSFSMELDFSLPMTSADKFEEFHRLNPQVYKVLESMTAEMVNRGRRKIGMKMLIEVLRWNYYMETDDPNSEFKVNNNYVPYYARLILECHPEWDGIFELRTMKG